MKDFENLKNSFNKIITAEISDTKKVNLCAKLTAGFMLKSVALDIRETNEIIKLNKITNEKI